MSNLVQNPSFENQSFVAGQVFADWENTPSVTIDTTNPFEGSKKAELPPTSAIQQDISLFPTFPTTPFFFPALAVEYLLSFAAITNPPTTGRLVVKVWWLDSLGNTIGPETLKLEISVAADTGFQTFVAATGIRPFNATGIRVQFSNESNKNFGIDLVTLVPVR